MSLNLEESHMVKDMGFVGEFPMMCHQLWRVRKTGREGWVLNYRKSTDKTLFEELELQTMDRVDTIAAPELLSGDPEHPGALEFIENLGYAWERCFAGGVDAEWFAYPPPPYGTLRVASPEALIAAVHQHWKAQQANANEPASGRSNAG